MLQLLLYTLRLKEQARGFIALFPCEYHSPPEHSVLVVSEREKETEWKPADWNISGTRNRNRCCNGSKSEVPKPGQSVESPLKQNGGHTHNLPHYSFISSATNLGLLLSMATSLWL